MPPSATGSTTNSPAPPALPSRGELWWVDLDPTRGHEQSGRRPALIFSADDFNHGRSGLVFVVAITTRGRGIAAHVEVQPPEGDLEATGYAMSDQLRVISKDRLHGRLGRVSPPTLATVADRVRMLFDL